MLLHLLAEALAQLDLGVAVADAKVPSGLDVGSVDEVGELAVGLDVLIDAIGAKPRVTLFEVFLAQRVCVEAKVSSG